MTANIVILTGAGISKASGLSTFRDADGIWATVRIEGVATPEAFARDPARVHDFYNARRRLLTSDEVAPNAAHVALARLETAHPGDVLVVTQNIDNLHERAGTRALIHMHGEMLKGRCTACDRVHGWYDDMSVAAACPGCGQAGGMRPDVVWFGEMPMRMEQIGAALAECDVFVSIGTSGNVYPAAGFAGLAKRAGARTVELNLEPSEGAEMFDESHHGAAVDVVPAYVARVLAGG